MKLKKLKNIYVDFKHMHLSKLHPHLSLSIQNYSEKKIKWLKPIKTKRIGGEAGVEKRCVHSWEMKSVLKDSN